MTVSPENNTACPQCGRPFRCSPGADCWCAARPIMPMPENPGSCLCPDCLEKRRRSLASGDKNGL